MKLCGCRRANKPIYGLFSRHYYTGFFPVFQPLLAKNVPKQRQARTAPHEGCRPGRGPLLLAGGLLIGIFGVRLLDLITLGLLWAVPAPLLRCLKQLRLAVVALVEQPQKFIPQGDIHTF